MEGRYRDIRDAIRKSCKHQITVTRDVMEKAYPGLFEKDPARAVVPAAPPAIPTEDISESVKPGASAEATKTTTPKNEFMPPAWALDVDDEDTSDVPLDKVKSDIEERLPFKDDVAIWEVMRAPQAHIALIELLDGNLPNDVERETTSRKYADYIVESLLSDGYAEEHMIPERNAQPPNSEDKSPPPLRAVPKRLLAVLQTIAVRYVGENFDINRFWYQVREHFPDVCTEDHEGKKPTAACLFQQAQSSVLEEEQAAKAAKTQSKDNYSEFLRLMQDYRSSSGEESPEAPAVLHETTLGLGAGLDTTIGQALLASHLRTKTTTTTPTEEGVERHVLRKRPKGDEEEGEKNAKKPRET